MWNSLNCSLRIDAVSSCLPVTGLNLANMHDVFLDNSCAGKCWFIMPRALKCMTTLQHYFRSKRTAAAETSAIYLLPHIKNAAWDVYTKRMAVLGTFSASSNIFSSHTDDTQGTPRTAQRPCSYILYFDAPHMPTGELCSSALPNSVRDVHMGPDAPTFIFTGKAAGMHSVILWDSGATKSLINADFAQRHNLHTTACSEPVKGHSDRGA